MNQIGGGLEKFMVVHAGSGLGLAHVVAKTSEILIKNIICCLIFLNFHDLERRKN